MATTTALTAVGVTPVTKQLYLDLGALAGAAAPGDDGEFLVIDRH